MTDSNHPCSSPRRARYQQQQVEARHVVKLKGAALLEAEQQARSKLAVEAPAVLGRFEAEARYRIAAAVRSSTVCLRSASEPVPCSAHAGSICSTCTCMHAGSTGSTVKPTSGRRKPNRSAIWPDVGHSSSCTCARNTFQTRQQLQQHQQQQQIQRASAAAGSHLDQQCGADVIQQLAPAGTGLGPPVPTAPWQVGGCRRPVSCSCRCHTQLAGHRPHSAPVASASAAVKASVASNNQHQRQQVPTPPNTQPQLPQSAGCGREPPVASGRQLLQSPGGSKAALGCLPRLPVSQKHVACSGSESFCCRQPPFIRCRSSKMTPIDTGGSLSGSTIPQYNLQSDCTKTTSRAADVTAEARLLQPLLGQSAALEAAQSSKYCWQQTGGAAKNAAGGAAAAGGISRVAPYDGQSVCASVSAVGSQHAVQVTHARPTTMSDAGACSSISPRQPRSPVVQVIASCHAAATGVLQRAVTGDRLDPMREPLLL